MVFAGDQVTSTAIPDRTPPASVAPAWNAAQFARVSGQLLEAAAQNPHAPVELTLDPEELGRVRMSLSARDNCLTVLITVDRPETLALMKRNIDTLIRDFREIGFSDVNLDFSDGRENSRDSDTNTAPADLPDRGPPGEENRNVAGPVLIHLAATAGGGLDLRQGNRLNVTVG